MTQNDNSENERDEQYIEFDDVSEIDEFVPGDKIDDTIVKRNRNLRRVDHIINQKYLLYSDRTDQFVVAYEYDLDGFWSVNNVGERLKVVNADVETVDIDDFSDSYYTPITWAQEWLDAVDFDKRGIVTENGMKTTLTDPDGRRAEIEFELTDETDLMNRN
jgi:hypothetical protein